MSNLIKNNKIFRNTLFLIILAELLSFLGYYYPIINTLVFFLAVILTIFISLYRLEYGLYILLTELFIGSFGYLFYFGFNGTQISIRLALWLVIMSVWLAEIIIQFLKTKKIAIDFFKLNWLTPLIILLIFIGWGLVNALVNGNSPSNIFFDFNNWLYFLLIFPIFSLLPSAPRATNAVPMNKRSAFSARIQENPLEIIKPIFIASITWLSVKTIILAYIFTHNFNELDLEIYGWMRTDRLGEITQTTAGFSRIFMQSHIYILIGFFILLIYLLKLIFAMATDESDKAISGTSSKFNKKMLLIKFLFFSSLFLTVIIISFSRSFWLGLMAGGIFVWLIALFKLKIKFKQFIIYNAIILFSVILSLILTLIAVKFPYPKAYGGFNPVDLLSQRATQITDEAGASSRWQLLPPLWQKIKTAPFLGRGFGSTVTYKTNDPRVLATSPDGLYTTYSFEWGWLDIWLKLGLFGLLAYLFLLFSIIKNGLKINSYFSLSLTTGLIVLMAVNVFSPYINHPLGIGYIIITMVIMNNIKTNANF